MDESTARSRHPDFIRQAFLWALLLSLALFLIASPAVSLAQVGTNITPTTGTSLDLGTNVDTVGTTTEITGGTRPGSGTNLFHSFDLFTLGTGDTAQFLNDMQLPTTNIVGRVIGGEVSTIDGTLRTNNPLNAADPMNFGAANLWLVNPSGLFLGPNVHLEVGGSVSISTANYLRFDGTSALFDMLSSPASLGPLSVAPVAAFGFLGSNPVLNATQSTLLVQGGTVQGSKTLTLVGRDATVGGTATPGIVLSGGTLSNSDGQINLVSVGLPQDLVKGGEIQAPSLISAPAASGHAFNTMGEIKLSGASLDTSGTTGGGVFIRGGQLTIDNGRIIAEKTGNTSDSPAGIDIKLDGPFALNFSEPIALSTNTSGAGDGGAIKIAASKVTLDFTGELSLSSATAIISGTSGAGKGGDVAITATGDVNLNRANIISETVEFLPFDPASGSGNAGSIVIKGENVTLTNSSISSSGVFGKGNSGALELEASSSVKLIGTSFVESISGSGQLTGNVTITAKNLSMEDGAVITAHTQGAGNAGNIIIKADDVVIGVESPVLGSSIRNDSIEGATGNAGSIDLSVGRLTLNPASTISSVGAGGGNAGTVEVYGLGGEGSKADFITLNNGAIFAFTEGQGTGGNISVAANDVTLNSFAEFSAGTSSASAAAHGGSITINSNQLQLNNGSSINTASVRQFPGSTTPPVTPAGDAGNITVTAQELNLTGTETNISVLTEGTGNAGNITLDTGQMTLSNGAQITTSSVGTATGRAGSITVQGLSGADSSAQSVSLSGANTFISSDTDNTGRGGDIQISAGQVQLADLASLTAETSGTGRAGSIGVTSDNLSVTGGARIEASTAAVGRAGDITITNTDTVSVTGLSSNESTRSGIFAKTQTSGGTVGGGSGGGGGGSGSGGGGGGAGGGTGGGGQTSTAGNAGNIAITTNNLLLSGGAQIDSSTTTSGSGGSLSVNADAITITGTSTSLKSDASRGNGTGGDITLAARTIGIHDKASVTAATDGSGNAGNISMTANENFTLDSAAVITTSTRGSGRGGTILINSPQVLVDGLGTSILADTLRPFADFAVTLSIVHTTDSDLTVRLDSPDGTRIALLSRVGGIGDNFTGTIFDDQATQPIASDSAPFTGTFKPREPLAQLIDQSVAGTWRLNVSDQVPGNTENPQSLESWSLRMGDQVFQSTNVPRNIPDNGSVSSNLVVAGPAGAIIQGVGEASGVGGDVMINGSTVTVQNGATLSATTRGSGQGGTVNVNATGPVAITGQGTGLFTDSEASGGSGNINVAAASMTMGSGARVSAASSGTGHAGNITINAGSEFLSTISSVTTAATQASGGNITLLASDMILLQNSQISASVFGEAETSGGNITIDPQFVILQNSQIIAQARAGSGGAIDITAGVFLADPASIVDASSTLGISGTVNVQSPVQNVGGQLTPLPQEFSSAAALLLAERCAADPTGQFSSFIQAGREGVPQIPGALSPSPLSFLETLTSSSWGSSSPNWAAARLGLDSVRFDDATRFYSACRS